MSRRIRHFGSHPQRCALRVQETEPGCISVSDSTYALLTDVDGFKPCPPIETPALGIITTWGRPVVERFAVVVTTTTRNPTRVLSGQVDLHARPDALASLADYLHSGLPSADDRHAGIRSPSCRPRPVCFQYPAPGGLCAAAHRRDLADPTRAGRAAGRPLGRSHGRDRVRAYRLYMVLRVAQASVMSLVDEQMRAPKLLLDWKVIFPFELGK
jgi:hypothetical protein